MYEKIIEPILTNTIVVDWIAPIVTTILASVVITVFGKIILNEKIKNKIKESNGKILDAIRPFIIQQIPITKEMIISIRDAISLEDKVKLKYLYTLEDIKNRLILDIAETRFIKENDKARLFKQINKIFLEESENIEELENTLEEEKDDTYEEINEKTLYSLYMILFIITMIIFSCWDITQIQNEFITNIITFLILFVLFAPMLFIIYKFFGMVMNIINWILEKIIS